MTLNYGRVWLDRDVSAKVMQFAVESPVESNCARGDDPMVENFYSDTRIGFDGGTYIRTFTVRDAVFRTKADVETFLARVQNTTGTMRLELQVTSGVTATSMRKFDGSNTTYEVFYKGHQGDRQAAPNSTVFKIRKIDFIQGS